MASRREPDAWPGLCNAHWDCEFLVATGCKMPFIGPHLPPLPRAAGVLRKPTSTEIFNLSNSSLRVMTFNLLTSTKKRRTHPWRLRKRSVARIFHRFSPDVVGTQEANFSQLLELAELLPDYEFIGEGNLSGTDLSTTAQNWYCAIFFRRETVRPAEEEGETYWLSPTPQIPASQFSLGTRPRVATWHHFEHLKSGRNFVFGTTHLEALNGWHRVKSAILLRRYIQRKVQQLGPQTPLFLTGDFNARADSRTIRLLHEPSGNQPTLYDAWREAGPGDPQAGATFAGLGMRDRVSQLLLGPRRIDYVFYRPRLTLLQVQKVGFRQLALRDCARPSDHYPVLADFALSA